MRRDAAGNLTERTDARQLVTNYNYDTLHRLTGIDYTGAGTTDVGYVYDPVGNRTSMTDGTGTTSYAYDGLNRVTSIVFPGSDEFEYAYNHAGNRAQMTYPDGKTLDYSYDQGQRLKTVTDWLNKTVTYTYNNAGYLTKTAFPNGVDATYLYDGQDRLTRVTNTGPGGLLSKHQYVLNKVGNRVKMTRTQGTNPAEVEEYTYDALYRLRGVDYADGDTTDYTYDAVGNRASMTVNGGTPLSYSYDDADQMTAAGGVSYGYEDNGNLTSRGADSFTYNHENLLTQAAVGGTTSSSGYNGDGLRMSQTVGANTTDYQWDIAGGLPVVVNDEAKTYTYGLDLLSQTLTSNGGRNYFNHDGLGSVSEVTRSSDGTTALSFEYDVFGEVRSGGGGNYWRFTGEQFDSGTGLYYLRARYYDPEIGRFLSQDPVAGLAGTPSSQNPYPYVRNNPVAFTDPTGQWPGVPGGVKKLAGEVFGGIEDGVGATIDAGRQGLNSARDCAGDVIDCTYPARAPGTTALENALRDSCGGKAKKLEGGITLVVKAKGPCAAFLKAMGATAFTVGHSIFTRRPSLGEETLAHETNHVDQYEILGDAFLHVYFGATARALVYCALMKDFGNFSECVHDSNILEILAGDP